MNIRVGGWVRRVSRSVVLLGAGILLLSAAVAGAIVTDMTKVANVHSGLIVHADQADLNAENAADPDAAFEEAFELGDELFGTQFNALDGVGANVGRGQRFSHVPRADLKGATEWFSHTPVRVTGPNAQGCFECHEQPFEDGSGTAAQNVHRDPFRTGQIGQFIERNTPHVFAPGAIQRLAEEMTDDLTADQNWLVAEACDAGGATRSVTLETKGINYGPCLRRTSGSSRNCTSPTSPSTPPACRIDNAVADNPRPVQLIVRPFQWKGSQAFIRDFNPRLLTSSACRPSDRRLQQGRRPRRRRNEMTIGDQTALAVYLPCATPADPLLG